MAYRPTERTEARRAAIRERIVTAARRLIAHGGYAEAQVSAVAREAGVATGTVYRHFPSKADLFAEVFREASQREVDAMREAVQASSGPAGERIAAGVETFARRALRGRRLAWALLAEPVDPAVEAERLVFRHSYRDLMAETLRDGIASGELPPQDVEATAAALIGAVGEAMVGPLSPTHPQNGSRLHKTGRSRTKRVAPLGAPSHDALALRPRTTNPEALIASLINFCTRAIGKEPVHVNA